MKKKLLKKDNNNKKSYYLPGIVHQAGLSGTHTPLIEVSTSYLNSDISIVPCWLFSFSFLGRLAVYSFSWGYLFALRFHNLESFSALQEGSIFCQHLIPELLDILQCSLLLLLLLLLCNSPLFSFLFHFGLYLLSCFLSYMLSSM